MNELTYIRILSEEDADIPGLLRIYHQPRIARFISIGDNYFQYVTGTENVYFYKVYDSENLIGAIHLEKCKDTLYMDILILSLSAINGSKYLLMRAISRQLSCSKTPGLSLWREMTNCLAMFMKRINN